MQFHGQHEPDYYITLGIILGVIQKVDVVSVAKEFV